jgi:amino acid adenylation domain-containing protein
MGVMEPIADGTREEVRGLTVAERSLLLAAGDRTGEVAPFVPVTDLIAIMAEVHGGNVAVEFGAAQLAYRDLWRLALHLTGHLDDYGIRRGDVVAVQLDRSLELVVAQLAVLAHGAVLLPLDPEQPLQRIDTMLSDSGSRLVLSGDAGPVGRISLQPVLDVVTALRDAPHEQPRGLGAESLSPEDASYALFTSGSTGRAKGVVNTHGGIANRIAWMQDTYRLTSDDRILYKTPVSFDVAMWEWLWPLTTGARVVVADVGAQRDPVLIARAIRDHDVTIAHFVPSMLRLFTAQPEARECRMLRQIVCSGEELTPVAVDEALEICPAVDNLYGPTEAAIDVTWWACRRGEARTPIGGPISGVCLRVVDESGELVPVGVAGELLVGGIALARGYINRPALTARAFIPDRWTDGARLYRTGDRVRWRELGVLEFLGRLDAQVKIRGVRVEPGEVEAVLGAIAGVLESVVVVQQDERYGPKLAAYVTGPVDVDALRGNLRTALPEVMVPSVIIRLDAMPRTASGKIDRAGLAQIGQSR